MSPRFTPLVALVLMFALCGLCLLWAERTIQQISEDKQMLIQKLAKPRIPEKHNDQCGQDYVTPPSSLSVCPAVHWLPQLDEQGHGEQIQCYCPCRNLSAPTL